MAVKPNNFILSTVCSLDVIMHLGCYYATKQLEIYLIAAYYCSKSMIGHLSFAHIHVFYMLYHKIILFFRLLISDTSKPD